MASTPADGAGEPVEAKGKGKEEGERNKAGGGVLGRMWRGILGGREDYEKHLQYLSKEEAAVHARMRRLTRFSRRTVRNITVLSVVAEVHKQPCHIVYTDYRPTPLQHYVFPAGGDGLYLVVDENGKFREDSSEKSLNVLAPASGNDRKRENASTKESVNFLPCSAFHLSYNMLLNQLRSEDGKVDSTQILHNLNEYELPGFEESWKGNAGQHLPGWNQNAGISNGDNSALLYSTLKLNEKKWLHGV
ncbi:hypothetical protein ZWY2020_056554 [Hordeum vulgare]|nr:hypothetical protein ZWY2020_056554 [Hordeum vulgare]